MPAVNESRYLVTCGWDDVPHLSADEKRRRLAGMRPHMRKARSQGIPTLGSGAIYPVPEESLVVQPFPIPEHWKRGYGMDVGWKWTAAAFLAEDPTDGTLYLYAEHKREETLPLVHAAAIKARGEWMHGAIDPASAGSNQLDGRKLYNLYLEQGLHLTFADNAVDEGIDRLWELMETGRFKVFSTCQDWCREFRKYHRDEKGRVVKADDHLLDATRYGVSRWQAIAKRKPFLRLASTTAMPADASVNY